MKRVCSWCRKDLETGEVYSSYDDSMTHGICEECLNNIEFQTGVELGKFIDSIDAPVAVVDSDLMIHAANSSAKETFAEGISASTDKSIGTVFECAYARYPEGCGRTVHCSGCAIRKSVHETFATGKPLRNIPATLKYADRLGPEMIRMKISTEKMKDIVFLRIDEMKKIKGRKD